MALVYDPRTGKLVDDGSDVPGNPARAAAMQAQFNQPVTGPRSAVPPVQPPVLAGTGTVDRSPARSLPAPAGDNPARAAAMQAQYDQPVTGPRGAVQPAGAGVQTAYSSNPLLRRMQAAADSDRQRYFKEQADRADRLRETIDHETSRALATAYDQAAGYNKAASLTAPTTYPEIPEFNTPVTAPAATPVAPAAPTSTVNPNAINVGGALGQAYLGSMAAVPATALDALRRGATSLVGGDVNSLPGGPTALRDRAFGAMDQGLSQLGQANANLWGNLQAAGRNALGVQAAPAAQPPAAAPAAAPEPAPAAPAPAPAAPAPAPAAAPEPAPTVPAPQSVSVQAPVRGDYNMTNTSRGTGAPANNGINFGFGVNGRETARQYLDRMALVDQQRSAERQRARNDVERITLEREVRGRDPFARRAARARSAELAASETAMFDRANNATMDAAKNAAALQQAQIQAQIQGQFGLAAEQMRGQFGLQEAELTGQFGVESATAQALGRVAQAELSADPVKQARAAMLETRLRQLNAKIAAGTATDEDFLNFTATVGSPSEQMPVNPVTGAPLSPQEVEAEQRRNLERLQQTR